MKKRAPLALFFISAFTQWLDRLVEEILRMIRLSKEEPALKQKTNILEKNSNGKRAYAKMKSKSVPQFVVCEEKIREFSVKRFEGLLRGA